MKLEKMRKVLEKSLAPKRFKHSIAVYETALELADVHKVDAETREKIAVSALLHDCGREVPTKESVAKMEELGLSLDYVERNQPILLHSKLGVYYAKEKYGVTDADILDGISFHTTGKANMSILAMIVFLADMLEPARNFPGVEELRSLARKDLEDAMIMAYSNTTKYLLEGGLLIHPNCIEGYNQLLLKKKASCN